MENQMSSAPPSRLSPFGFEVTGSETIKLPLGRVVEIQKAKLKLKSWNGVVDFDTYNHKPLIDGDGEPLFAELAVLRLLQHHGWQGVWADSYRRKFRTVMPDRGEPATLPSAADEIYQRIKSKTGKRGGCWDIFTWKNGSFAFLELKRTKKDVIRLNQILWLQAALDTGISADSFLLVEWELQS